MTGLVLRAWSIIRALTMLATLAVLIVGLPLALYRLGGSPIPERILPPRGLAQLLLNRNSGSLFLGTVRDVSWLGWAAFTSATIAESHATFLGRQATRLPGLGGMQNAAGRMIATITLAFSTPTAVLGGAASGAVATISAAVAAPAAALAANISHSTIQHLSSEDFRVVTVEPGQCLWQIAQRYLGSGDRYTEISDLNYGRHMGSGEVFLNPSVIVSGWHLRLPPSSQDHWAVDKPSAGSGQSEHSGHTSSDSRFSGSHQAALANGSPPSSGGEGPPASPSASAAGAEARSAPPSATAGEHGAATFAVGMLAGGLLTALARARRRQRQDRRPGRRIALPASTPSLRTEQWLRASAEGGADNNQRELQAATLRSVLRDLAESIATGGSTLPAIVGVHITPGSLELLLTVPALTPPPAPFIVAPGRQGMGWQLQTPSMTRPRLTETAEMGDLLPGLLNAGLAADGGTVLIDLEALRITACSGPPDLVATVLSSAATEMATTQLAGWYDLALVGFSELEHTSYGRSWPYPDLDQALDALSRRAGELRYQLMSGSGIPDIRLRRISEPGWDLMLLVSRIAPTEQQMDRLLEITSQGGVAALVAAGPGTGAAPSEIVLTDDPSGPGNIISRIMPMNFTVRLQPLTQAQYRDVTTLFMAANQQTDIRAEEPPYSEYGPGSWLPHAEEGWLEPPRFDGSHDQHDHFTAGFANPDHANDPDAAGDFDAHTPGCDQSNTEAEAYWGYTPAPQAHDPYRPTWPDLPCGPEEPAAVLSGLHAKSPLRVTVLGPFGVIGPTGPILGAQAELILALALAGSGGLSSSALRTFLGADPDHPKGGDALRQMTARIRSKLGEAPGHREWVEHLGGGQFALHPAAELDWDRFHALASTGLRDRHAGDLRAALVLVRGEPFSGCFPWWLETPLIETVRAEIVDVAEMLSDLESRAGDYGSAIRAAWAGLAAELAAEPLWRAVMRAEHANGNLAGVRSAWQRCLEAIADIGPEGEPHQETVGLFRELTRASASTRT